MWQIFQFTLILIAYYGFFVVGVVGRVRIYAFENKINNNHPMSKHIMFFVFFVSAFFFMRASVSIYLRPSCLPIMSLFAIKKCSCGK